MKLNNKKNFISLVYQLKIICINKELLKKTQLNKLISI